MFDHFPPKIGKFHEVGLKQNLHENYSNMATRWCPEVGRSPDGEGYVPWEDHCVMKQHREMIDVKRAQIVCITHNPIYIFDDVTMEFLNHHAVSTYTKYIKNKPMKLTFII